ncbi:MAG: response regulator [Bacteroidota bacterium]|nr:response regulator [Bacteroidota bacterium]
MSKHGNILVYIVDDDKMYSEVLKHFIETSCKELEPHVEIFVVGETFLMSIDKKPDLVILDYSLNSKFDDAIDGLEVLKRIQDVSPNTRVVMLSVKAESYIAMQAIDNGAYDYVVKDESAFEKIKRFVEEVYEEKKSFFQRIASFFTSSRKSLEVLENR